MTEDFLPLRLIFRRLTRDIIITHCALECMCVHTQTLIYPQDMKAVAALLQIKTTETLQLIL